VCHVTGALERQRILMRRLLLIPVLVFALAVGFASPARATTPIVGSGTVTTLSSTTTPIDSADGNTFYSVSLTQVETGIETASCSATYTLVIHPDGTGNFKGPLTCTGTIAGHPGTWLEPFVGTLAADGSFQLQYVISGAGGLANLHGHGTGGGNVSSVTGTYTDYVEFSG
jgi:hypothetical protein